MNVHNHLAGNPTSSPKFYTEIVKQNGEKMVAVDPQATRAMVALMDMNAVMGGAASHYGGPAAFAEIMSALHAYIFDCAKAAQKNWYELFNVINDAGHCENGIYALKANYQMAGLDLNKLKGFRSITSALSGHGEAHLFPEGVLLSNGPLGSAFPQSQGLALGDALAERARVTVTTISDGACMEGEAREAMAAIPGFAAQGKLAPYVLIISDNNTKLSGRIDKEAFSMAPTFKALETLGWKVMDLEDGHDLQKCFDVISNAIETAKANPNQPIVVHAKTIKGIGTKKTEESSSGGHGFPLKSPKELAAFIGEIYDGQEFPSEFQAWINEMIEAENNKGPAPALPFGAEEKIQVGISAAMVRARKAGYPVVSITSDLPGSTGVAGFRKEYPHFSFDVGIAESNMISTAAGFSKTGFVPVVDTFAQFGVTKGALPLVMASLSHAPMICVFSHTGFQDAADGASHQALSYFSMLSSIPDVELHALASSEEADALVFQAIKEFSDTVNAGKTPKTTVFFLGRENFPKTYVAGMEYQLRKAQVLKDTTTGSGKAVTIVAPGSMAYQAMIAVSELASKGIASIVLNPGLMNYPDVATLQTCLKKTNGNLIVVEDHQAVGGFAANLAWWLNKNNVPYNMKSLGVMGHFGQSAYMAQELYEKHHIDWKSIVRAAQEFSK